GKTSSRCTRGRRCPAREHHVGSRGHDTGSDLVEHFEKQADKPEKRPALRCLLVENGHAHAQHVAWTHRREPADLFDARRAHGRGIEHEAIGNDAHHDRAGVPAGCTQSAHQRRARRLFVKVHRLRIKLGRERLDILGADKLATVFIDLADGKILPKELCHEHPCHVERTGACNATDSGATSTALTRWCGAGSLCAHPGCRWRPGPWGGPVCSTFATCSSGKGSLRRRSSGCSSGWRSLLLSWPVPSGLWPASSCCRSTRSRPSWW